MRQIHLDVYEDKGGEHLTRVMFKEDGGWVVIKHGTGPHWYVPYELFRRLCDEFDNDRLTKKRKIMGEAVEKLEKLEGEIKSYDPYQHNLKKLVEETLDLLKCGYMEEK